MTKRNKIRLWKNKWYPVSSAGDLGGGKALATWFKEKGVDVLKLRLQKRFHLDMFCTEMIADRFIRQYHLLGEQK